MQPNFLIIGAQKSGTSSLYHYLRQHPDIFMSSPIKEPGYYMDFEFMQTYFASSNKLIASREELLDKYMLDGYQDEKRFGEASTYYTLGNRSIEFNVPKRIYSECPTMQFIYLLRNPFDRVISAFLHHQKYANPTFSSLDAFVQSDQFAISTSLYFQQLKAYLAYFPIKQFHFLLFEDFIQNPQKALMDIFTFLKIQQHLNKTSFKIFNQSTNRQNFNKEALFFSKYSYAFLLEQFEKDLINLKNTVNFDFKQWDFSEEKWVF